MERKYEIDWERLERELDMHVEPIRKKVITDAVNTMITSPVPVPQFIIPKPSKWDIAGMGIARALKIAVPIAAAGATAYFAGAPAGIAVGTVAAGIAGVAKAKKEVAKSQGNDPGVWDIIGRLVQNVIELIQCFRNKRR